MNKFRIPFKGFYKIKLEDNDCLIKGYTDNEVKAIENGVVYGVGFDKLYKNYLVLYNDINKTYTSYLGFDSNIGFNIGDKVLKGEYLGEASGDGIKLRVAKNCLCISNIINFIEYSGIYKNYSIIDYNCLTIYDKNNKKIININNRRVNNGY